MDTNIEEKPAYISREEKIGITQEFLKATFDYKDGFFYWKISLNTSIKIGDLAGCFHKSTGRYRVIINGNGYHVSRLVFCYQNGYFPQYIDHIDRNRANDKIENLRPATWVENSRNKTPTKNQTSKSSI